MSSPPPYRYTERPPSPESAACVLTYWHFAATERLDALAPYTVPPDGCTNVVVLVEPNAPRRLLCIGPRASPFQPGIIPGMRLLGVRLWPDMTLSVTGVPATALRDYQGMAPPAVASRLSGLVPLVGDAADADAVFRAVDGWLGSAIVTRRPEPRVRRAVHAIAAARGELSLEQAAAAAHVSPRQLQRLFRATTGLTVSEYARIRRLRESLAMHLARDDAPWSRIAAERGFSDHAHLTREFVALAGVAPSAVARQLARIEHRDVRP